MSEQAFAAQIPKTLDFEGGYVNDPSDPGGETNFGISKAAYPELDIKTLTRDQAIAIYRRDYWIAPRIAELPDAVSGKVFDAGVNMGPHTAVRLWQETVNSLRSAGTPSLVVDGRIGPATIAASAAAVAHFAGKMLTAYRSTLASHYMAIIAANPSMARYQRGWLRRAMA